MASLLERMNLSTGGPSGVVRSKSGPPKRTNSPYTRPVSKGDIDSQWSHDMFDAHNSLEARLGGAPGAPKANLSHGIVGKALQAATAASGISIKGAGSAGNVVEVTGLVDGTTTEDVVAIFKRCGEIVKATSISPKPVTIRVTFKTPASATSAVNKFNNQPADGKMLSVQIVGSAATSLGGRLGGMDGLGLVREEGSVDVLMESSADGGSKMRSDSLLRADPRAQVLVAPPGADPADYVQTPASRNGGGAWRGGRGGRGGRRGRGKRGGNGGGRMDID
ncbi:hypothetical protein FB45DRAFT_205013 [Roridomyces roridus]|uniref:RRM domain-containing protein n=1 Tax=Roridomyces roridus TaxID=1738132 RepID=A0AAD7CFT3_9AGAR|nr:hypothetical protein FB45DRAFT_205013 [Roridomyces roridus]